MSIKYLQEENPELLSKGMEGWVEKKAKLAKEMDYLKSIMKEICEKENNYYKTEGGEHY